MARALTRNVCALGAVVLVATGCKDFGYVELKTVPTSGRALVLYLDNERLEPPRSGVAVLRQAVGTRKLQTEAGGQPSLLCDVVVKKDRITTVTVSTFERPPRCTCARPSGNNAEGRRTCIG